MVPVEQRGRKVVTFILVPYVGACIHVPPPPENQLVLVTAETPYKSTKLFEPITVTGEIQTASMATHMARVGYAITAKKVEPYG